MPKKMINTKGETTWKRMIVRVFFPGNKKSRVFQKVAPANNGYNEDAIEKMLDQMAENVESTWPNHEYRLVVIAPNQFNFVWESEREAKVASFGMQPVTGEENATPKET